jgi:hypothetical protein
LEALLFASGGGGGFGADGFVGQPDGGVLLALSTEEAVGEEALEGVEDDALGQVGEGAEGGVVGQALTLDVGGSAAAEALGDELLAQRLLERAHEGQDDVDLGVGDLDGRILGALGVAGLLAPGEVGAGIGQRGADGAGGGADVTARAGGRLLAGEVADQRDLPAVAAVDVVLHGLPARHRARRGGLAAQARLGDGVGAGVEQDAGGGGSVAPGAAGLLVVGGDAAGGVGVDDVAHVRLVDAHAEGRRRDEDGLLARGEGRLGGVARAVGAAGVVVGAGEAGLAQRIMDGLHPLTGRGVDDGATGAAGLEAGISQ